MLLLEFQKCQNTEARVHSAKYVSLFKFYDKKKMRLYFFLW